MIWKGDAGKIVINNTAYKLLQCHWHTPSEHTLNDTRLVNLNLKRKDVEFCVLEVRLELIFCL